MTKEKEAIERLKQNKAAAEFYAGMIQNANAIENELKDIEAIDLAIEALQKSIPKPPKKDKEDNLLCPLCGEDVDWHKYCEECGQAIKW